MRDRVDESCCADPWYGRRAGRGRRGRGIGWALADEGTVLVQYVTRDQDEGHRLAQVQGVRDRQCGAVDGQRGRVGQRYVARHDLDQDDLGRVTEGQMVDAVMSVPDNGPLLDDGDVRQGYGTSLRGGDWLQGPRTVRLNTRLRPCLSRPRSPERDLPAAIDLGTTAPSRPIGQSTQLPRPVLLVCGCQR